jgi:ACT domain-containing protein
MFGDLLDSLGFDVIDTIVEGIKEKVGDIDFAEFAEHLDIDILKSLFDDNETIQTALDMLGDDGLQKIIEQLSGE